MKKIADEHEDFSACGGMPAGLGPVLVAEVNWKPAGEKETILQEAQRLVHGDRNKQYGSPLSDFTCIAAMWSAFITKKYGAVKLAPEDVGCLMVLMKISREANGHKRDSLVDTCGYAECIQWLLDERDGK